MASSLQIKLTLFWRNFPRLIDVKKSSHVNNLLHKCTYMPFRIPNICYKVPNKCTFLTISMKWIDQGFMNYIRIALFLTKPPKINKCNLRNHINNLQHIINSVVEFQKWLDLKSKIFAQKSTCLKEKKNLKMNDNPSKISKIVLWKSIF